MQLSFEDDTCKEADVHDASIDELPESIEDIPLLVPTLEGSRDILLDLDEDEMSEEEEKEESSSLSIGSTDDRPLLSEVSSSSTSDHKSLIQEMKSVEKPALEKPTREGFRPLIQVVASSQIEEDDRNEGDFSSAPLLTSLSSHPDKGLSSIMKKSGDKSNSRNTKSVSFSGSNSTVLLEREVDVTNDEAEEGTGLWATRVKTPASQPEGKETLYKSCEEVEDLELDFMITPSKELQHSQPPKLKELKVEEVSPSDFKLSDVPIVDAEVLQKVDDMLGAIEGKPESQLTQEEKVWRLAASGGSTQDSDTVALDPETKARLQHTLKESGMLDKVSLKF